MKVVRYVVVGVAIFAIVALFTAASFAETIGEASKAAVQKGSEFVGKVVSVTVADPAKGIANGAVTIGNKLGKTTTFTVKGTAKILAHTMDVITLNQLKIDDKVDVTAKDGEAQTIKIVK